MNKINLSILTLTLSTLLSMAHAECPKDPPVFPDPTGLSESVIAGETVICGSTASVTAFKVWLNAEMAWEFCEDQIPNIQASCGPRTIAPVELFTDWKSTGPNTMCMDLTEWENELLSYFIPRTQSWDYCAQTKE